MMRKFRTQKIFFYNFECETLLIYEVSTIYIYLQKNTNNNNNNIFSTKGKLGILNSKSKYGTRIRRLNI